MKEISKQYAEAIFALACECGREEPVMHELELVLNVLADNPEYMDFLVSPSVPRDERVASLGGVFAARVCEHVLSLLQLMCEKGRIGAISSCVEEYRTLLHLRQAVVTANVTSAVALTQDQKSALIQKLEKMSARQVQLSCRVDPTLLGGMIVEMDGKIMDGSLRYRLRDVKEVMSQ